MAVEKVSVEDFLNASNQSEKFSKLNSTQKKTLISALQDKLTALTDTHDYFFANNEYKKAQPLEREIGLLKNALAIVKPVVDNTVKLTAISILSAPESQRKDMFDNLVEFSKGSNGKLVDTSDAFKQKVRDELQNSVDQLKKEQSSQILPNEKTRKQLENAEQTLKIITEPEPTQRIKPR